MDTMEAKLQSINDRALNALAESHRLRVACNQAIILVISGAIACGFYAAASRADDFYRTQCLIQQETGCHG